MKSIVRMVMLSAFTSVCLMGCGDDNGTNSNGGGNNTCTSGGSCRSVTIGGQRWMSENLNIETADSWCYENDPANCTKYGRLYTWEAAKTVCPAGWKLPDTADWRKLVATAGDMLTAGKKLKSTSGWSSSNGTNVTGFSALPGGFRDYTDGRFGYAGNAGYWWTATENNAEYDGSRAYVRAMTYVNDLVLETNYNKSYGQSVRCLEN
jgi:uncharacterized protein (TIGR02145 family)